MPGIQIDEQVVDQKLATLESARQWSPRVVSKLEAMIRAADDFSLFRVNPVQFGSEKGIAENEAIDLFLHAAKQGLFEMEWHLVCAACGHVVESLGRMESLHADYVCKMCSTPNRATLDDYIQVTFTVSPLVRDIAFHHPESLSIEDYYLRYHLCKGIARLPGGPSIEEELLHLTRLMAYLAPQEKRVVECAVEPGVLQATDRVSNALLTIPVSDAVAPDVQRISLAVGDGQFRRLDRAAAFRGEADPAGPSQRQEDVGLCRGNLVLEVTNLTEKRCACWLLHFPADLEEAPLQFDPFLSGKRLLSTQTFRDLFRTEAVHATESLGVKDITFLFTDLKGSTAMYDRVGDPQAYYLVRQHFDTLGTAVGRNSGAIVKTIGDAIMATFVRPADAVRAAMEMLRGIEAFNRSISQQLALKIGIHCGHAIVVTLNDRLDYFGQTVNIAARVQGLADAGEIYISEDAYARLQDTDVFSGCAVSPELVNLKGIGDKTRVRKVTIP